MILFGVLISFITPRTGLFPLSEEEGNQSYSQFIKFLLTFCLSIEQKRIGCPSTRLLVPTSCFRFVFFSVHRTGVEGPLTDIHLYKGRSKSGKGNSYHRPQTCVFCHPQEGQDVTPWRRRSLVVVYGRVALPKRTPDVLSRDPKGLESQKPRVKIKSEDKGQNFLLLCKTYLVTILTLNRSKKFHYYYQNS